jgi:circadian clock protein KaiB
MKARWQLRLYIAGALGRSAAALTNLRSLCVERLGGECEVEVVDLTREPARARSDGVVVVPTLERTAPKPVLRVVGDLSNAERVLAGLELKPS